MGTTQSYKPKKKTNKPNIYKEPQNLLNHYSTNQPDTSNLSNNAYIGSLNFIYSIWLNINVSFSFWNMGSLSVCIS